MKCNYHLNETSQSPPSDSHPIDHAVIKSGFFLRQSDGLLIQRFFCKTCQKSFSTETKSPLRYQKKRHLNDFVFSLFASGTSQRRMAKLLTINRKTVVRKFIVLGKICLHDMSERKHLPVNYKVQNFIFDDIETFEHTKLKPLSITLAVEERTRRILDFRISSMKANGHLAQRSKLKYGHRKDERRKNLYHLLGSLKTYTSPQVSIKSDMNPHYSLPVKKIFPKSIHQVFKGKKGCVVGQGELKATSFDPLFSLNHTAAMLRANISRLFRKTWNTTKKPVRLSYHIAIYVFYHNLRLLKDP